MCPMERDRRNDDFPQKLHCFRGSRHLGVRDTPPMGDTEIRNVHPFQLGGDNLLRQECPHAQRLVRLYVPRTLGTSEVGDLCWVNGPIIGSAHYPLLRTSVQA
ncbi:unnamed protein product [Cuscuta epithymum]|uniref:Uncharacterized protein n=1 Tax=Cuscuta epithymum TaxID=186058 RepID=A0AAV0FNE1_9ASTE|nr:unnamed protein product [Cuscuta epithymum]